MENVLTLRLHYGRVEFVCYQADIEKVMWIELNLGKLKMISEYGTFAGSWRVLWELFAAEVPSAFPAHP